jgi:hypothetical protein
VVPDISKEHHPHGSNGAGRIAKCRRQVEVYKYGDLVGEGYERW